MPSKYKCQDCSRSFVHKETLKEHKLLHGLVIIDDNKFSCPVCQCEVTCRYGAHHHSKNYCITGVQAAKGNSNEAKLKNGISVNRNLAGESIKLRLKNKNCKWKEMTAADVADASSAVFCKICSKSFVYQKCLQKHAALVHGLPSDEKPENETKSVGMGRDRAVLPRQAKSRAECQQSVVKESVTGDSDNQNSVNTMSGDDADVVLEDTTTKELPPEIHAQTDVAEIGKAVQLKVDPLDLVCKTCHKQFKHKAMLLRHMQTMHGETDFERCACPLCLEKFCSQCSFSKHFDTEHQTKAAEILASLADGQTSTSAGDGTSGCEDITRCEKCSHWFTCSRSYEKHCNRKHRDDFTSVHTDELYRKSAESTELIGPDVEDKQPYANMTTSDSKSLVFSDSKVEGYHSGSSSDKTMQDIADNHLQMSSKYCCSVCNKTFASANFLDRHIRLKHSRLSDESPNSDGKLEFKTRKQTFVCGYCSEEFHKEIDLTEHVETCHKGLMLDSLECTCPICGCSCPNQALFSFHYNAVHFVNAATYDATTSLLSQSANNTACRCKFCELWFTNEEFFHTHHCTKQTAVRQPPKIGRARYRCMQCGEAFEILRCFLHHRKVKHRVVGPEKKDETTTHTAVDAVNGLESAASQAHCMRGRPPKTDDVNPKQNDNDQKQTAPLEEQQHMTKDFVSSSLSGGLRCPDCKRSFLTVAELRRHRKSEHRNKMCQLCGEVCKSADMVYYHNLKYHHEQKCEVCGASCSGRLGLIDHFRSQHPTEPPPLINRKTLICEYCPRVFASCASRLLRDHIESCHLGRVHLCDVCGKRLGSAQTLAVHRRMHDPVARFECHECNRRFPHNTNLMNHIRKHHPERLPAKYVREFRCDVCSMQFGSSSGLSRHRSEKHGSHRFQCEQCLRVFPSISGLRVHKRRDHQPKDMSSTLAIVPSAALPAAKVAACEEPILAPPPPPHVTQFTADPTIMAGFMANMIGLPGLGQTFQ